MKKADAKADNVTEKVYRVDVEDKSPLTDLGRRRRDIEESGVRRTHTCPHRDA